MLNKIILILGAPVMRVEVDLDSIEIVASRWSVKPERKLHRTHDEW